jgi:hypothetical protein
VVVGTGNAGESAEPSTRGLDERDSAATICAGKVSMVLNTRTRTRESLQRRAQKSDVPPLTVEAFTFGRHLMCLSIRYI